MRKKGLKKAIGLSLRKKEKKGFVSKFPTLLTTRKVQLQIKVTKVKEK